jgi:RNA polymerase primary sigma factor
VTSLDRPVGEDGDTDLGALLPSDRPAPDEEVSVALEEHTLRRAIARLPEEERDVVKLRYGINGNEATTIRETGRRLGIPGRQVERLEEQALRRLASEREIESLRDAA